MVVSSRNNGFAKASEGSLGSFLTVPLDKSLLWTGLPPFLVAFFAMWYGETLAAAADRQPYVDLNHDVGSAHDVRRTILLEYSGYHALYNWWVALRNRHYHLSMAMLAQLTANLILAPLVSNVFAAKPTWIDVHLISPDGMNLSALLNADLQPALDLTSAMLAYGAAPPIWMQSNASVEPVYIQPSSQTGEVNFTGLVTAAEPRCQIIDSTALEIIAYNSSAFGFGSVGVSFEDRGCSNIRFEYPTEPNRRIYSRTWSQTCGGDEDPQDRVGIFAAAYSPDSEYFLSDVTVISCWPKYWNTSTKMTVAFDAIGPRELKGIDKAIATSGPFTSLYLRSLHTSLEHYATMSAIGVDLDADSFGNIVHAYAQRLSPGTDVDPTAYLNATIRAYSTFWASVASTQLLKPLNPPRLASGTLTFATNKVHVVKPIAGILLALLFWMTASTAILLIHVLHTCSILFEDPHGLLGQALLLLKSDVTPCVEGIKNANPTKLKLLEYIKSKHDTKESMCWYDWDSGASTGRIRLHGLDKAVSPRPTWWSRIRARIWPSRTSSK
ncbi:uncharacterized protein AB675_8525 [Cyphellophora attinorum]|uniref:Uncharacterized protein n=1 Tax=Cyphellophora attinorum TaxID=1664694 RepID=A0A0N0NQU7_9EURO|nr:uncharacterized protein AB675_8525 [Phialophora attinorum]KPI44341.1 hypothetical protein AB675_8525 [Phialophora attinorum]